MVIGKPKSSSYRNKPHSVKINIDVRTFTIICRYILSSSSYLRTSHLLNLRKFMTALDPASYENDAEKIKRVRFIELGLEARIDNKLTDQEMIITHIYSNLNFDVDFIDINNLEMNSNELMWVHTFIEDNLKYMFAYDSAPRMLDICTQLLNSDSRERMGLIKQFEDELKQTLNKFHAVKQDNSVTDIQFSLRDGTFEKSVEETYRLITNPSRRLITGMQGLNEMLHGGFESGRVYMFLGLTGMGKSLVLLNLMYQIKKYNAFYKPKDPTKTPCIVLLTMENTVVETITRLFDLSVTDSLGMENYSLEEVLRKLRQEGQLVLNQDYPIDIVIRYKANRSVDTNYLYELTDELENDNYEVICLVQDHVKRIRSIWGSPDLRIELGDIVNEFKVFAAEKDIPVITNSHLNRDAAHIVEENSVKSSKVDITMKLGKSNAGESLLMIDNLDGAFIINRDQDDEGTGYMVFKSIKYRDKESRTYIVQPFVYGSGIKLVEDVGGVPQFKESLHKNMEINNRMATLRTSPANIISNIPPLQINKENAFAQTSSVEKLTLKDPYEDEDDIQSGPQSEIICPIHFVDIEKKDEKLNLESLANLKMQLENRATA